MTRLGSPRGLAWLQRQALPGASGVAWQRLTRALIAVDAEARAAEADVQARAAADPIAAALATSAGRVRYGPITRQGSPWIRWAFVEAAIHALKRPDATGRWARRLAGRISICPARVA